jgi:nucleoside-diphosphate-sugar epimerase
MSILVTGCAGFIGYHLTQKLLKEGFEVIGIDNINSYYDVKLKRLRLDHISSEKFSFQEMDIEDRNGLKKLFDENKIEKVFNLAGRAGVRASLSQPFEYFDTNTVGTLNLLDLCREKGIKTFVTASTSSVYSNVETPFHEGQKVDMPISPYAASKRSAELMAYTYAFQYKMNISALRFFTVYGPFGRPDMSVLRFIRWVDEGKAIQLYGTGEQARDFTYVDDIVNGIIKSSEQTNAFQVYNLGGGNNPISMLSLIAEIENQLGKKAHINHLEKHNADVDVTWADITKAEKELAWKPKTELLEGLRATIAWYLNHKEALKNIPF